MMTIDDIRVELRDTIAELRTAATMPWQVRQVQSARVMFPELAARLLADEAAPLLAAFAAELDRLDGAIPK